MSASLRQLNLELVSASQVKDATGELALVHDAGKPRVTSVPLAVRIG